MLATVRTVSAPTVWRALAVGMSVGVAALTRGELLLLGPALAVALLVAARSVDLGRRMLLCGVAAAGAVAVLAPWAVHNADRFEERVLLSTNDGDTLVGANCDETYSGDLSDSTTGTAVCSVRRRATSRSTRRSDATSPSST